MKDIKSKILSNKEITPGYFKMALGTSYIAKHAKPGQFVQIRCSEGTEPLLRRPFSIHRVAVIGYRPSTLLGTTLSLSKGRLSVIEIIYEVVGRGTELLSKRKNGDFIDVLGPLGNGFILPRSPITDNRSTILIAGGIGVAPLLFLAEQLAKKKIKTIVLIGAKTKKQILCEKDFKKFGAEVHTTTDDGTCGCKGLVSRLFEKVIRETCHVSRFTAYVCGPHPMLECIAGICKERKIDCQVSLEEMMACGIGACLGCAVKVKPRTTRFARVRDMGGGSKLACKDGPVFNADEIIWS